MILDFFVLRFCEEDGKMVGVVLTGGGGSGSFIKEVPFVNRVHSLDFEGKACSDLTVALIHVQIDSDSIGASAIALHPPDQWTMHLWLRYCTRLLSYHVS
jgi:hypothetical protein